MEIVDEASIVTEPVKKLADMGFEEVFPDEPLNKLDISDRDWAIFELVKTKVKETGLIQSLEIARRISTPKHPLFACLKKLWRAGIIRRFLRVRYGISKGQPGKSQVWYVINQPERYQLPEVKKPAKRTGQYKRKEIPDEVVAQIRRYPPEITNEAIARRFNISISHVENLRNYVQRKDILP